MSFTSSPPPLQSVSKRSRSPTTAGEHDHNDNDQHSGAQKTRRIDDINKDSEQLVRALSSVNSEVVNGLLKEWTASEGRTAAASKALRDVEGRLLSAHRSRVHTELTALKKRQEDTCRTHAVKCLSSQLQHCTGDAVSYLSDCIATATRTALDAMHTRAGSEREITNALLAHVRDFIRTAFQTLESNAQRTLQAELKSSSRDVTIARLQAALSVSSARQARHAEELNALLRVVAALADKSKHVREATEDLARSRAHVDALEKHLDLNGIVAAIAPASSLAQRNTPPPPPPESLEKTAPEYFAVRTVAHMDITLSELVQRWRDQEEVIHEHKSKYDALEASVKSLRRDAMVVHQRLIEEQQRRSVAERRITEMVRERLIANHEAAAVKELTELRWNYTQVVDDAAQLAASLTAAREELAEAKTTAAELREKLQQVEKDAAADEVATALLRMRAYYEDTLVSLQNDMADAEAQRRLLSATAEERGGALSETAMALRSAQSNSRQLADSADRRAVDRHAALSALHTDTVSKLQGAREAVDSSVAHVHSNAAQLQSHQQALLKDQQVAVAKYEEQLVGLVNAIEASLPSLQKPQHADATHPGPAEALARMQSAEHIAAMQAVVQEALQFVTEHLKTTDEERTNLVDASVSDAAHMAFVLTKLKEVTAQRDGLRAQLSQCYDLIEANHITVVERALLHEVSVEDSLDAAEAAEQIQLLQAQQAASTLALERTSSEHQSLLAQWQQMQSDLQAAREREQLLVQQQQALTEVLSESKARECSLAAQLERQQQHVEAIVTSSATSADPAQDQGAASSRLEATLATMGDTLSQLTATMDALKAQRSSGTTASGQQQQQQDSAEEIAKRLDQGGVRQLVPLLRDALVQANLLQAATKERAVRSTVALTEAAIAVGQEAELCTTDMRNLAQAHAENKELKKSMETMQADREGMLQRLALAEENTRKAEAANQRILGVSKNIMEKHAALIQETKQLKAAMEQLKQQQQQNVQNATDNDAVEPTISNIVAEAEIPQPQQQSVQDTTVGHGAVDASISNAVAHAPQQQPEVVAQTPLPSADSNIPEGHQQQQQQQQEPELSAAVEATQADRVNAPVDTLVNEDAAHSAEAANEEQPESAVEEQPNTSEAIANEEAEGL